MKPNPDPTASRPHPPRGSAPRHLRPRRAALGASGRGRGPPRDLPGGARSGLADRAAPHLRPAHRAGGGALPGRVRRALRRRPALLHRLGTDRRRLGRHRALRAPRPRGDRLPEEPDRSLRPAPDALVRGPADRGRARGRSGHPSVVPRGRVAASALPGHTGPPPRDRTRPRPRGALRGRMVRDGGPAQLVGRVVQDLLHAAQPALPGPHGGGGRGAARGHRAPAASWTTWPPRARPRRSVRRPPRPLRSGRPPPSVRVGLDLGPPGPTPFGRRPRAVARAPARPSAHRPRPRGTPGAKPWPARPRRRGPAACRWRWRRSWARTAISSNWRKPRPACPCPCSWSSTTTLDGRTPTSSRARVTGWARRCPAREVGGGASHWFADLNRNREAAQGAEVVSFALCPQVHARDGSHHPREPAEPLRHGAHRADLRGPGAAGALARDPGVREEAPDPRLGTELGATWVRGLLAAARAAGFWSLSLGPGLGPAGIASGETLAYRALLER